MQYWTKFSSSKKKNYPQIKLYGYEINEEAVRKAEKFNVGKITKPLY